jgi:chemotaxis protein histidine kinase CheA
MGVAPFSGLDLADPRPDNANDMPPDESGTPVDTLQHQLKSVIDAQFAAFSVQYAAALDEARRRVREDTERAFNERIDTLRDEWAARLDADTRSLRAEGDRRVAEATAAVLAEAERRTGDAVAQARADSEQQAAARLADAHAAAQRRLDESVARVRAEAERIHAELLARTRTDMERTAAIAIAAARTEADRRSADAIAQARADIERASSEAIAQARSDAEARAQEAIVQARADAQRTTDEAIAQAREDADRRAEERIAQARAEIERAASDAIAQAHADAERRAAEAVGQARADAEQRLEEAIAQARTAAQAEADERVADARADAEREAADTLAQVRMEADRHHAEALARTREELERTLAAERIRAEHAIADERDRAESALAAREVEAATARQTVRAVVAAVRALDHSTSLTHALETLTEHAAAVAGRAAVFVLSGDRLSSFRTAGFPSTNGSPYETSLSGTGLLSLAVRSREMQLSSMDVPPPAFAAIGPEQTGIAVPLSVGERVVAVLYADAAVNVLDVYGSKGYSHPSSRDWTDAVDAMARHASLVLGAVTAARTVQAVAPRNGDMLAIAPPRVEDEQRARRYARLLLSEIKLYNESAIRLGRQQRDLLQRLRPEIDRARRLYEERVPPTIGGRATYFQQELVQALADGDAALLGTAV